MRHVHVAGGLPTRPAGPILYEVATVTVGGIITGGLCPVYHQQTLQAGLKRTNPLKLKGVLI